jgi:hypothetical protein
VDLFEVTVRRAVWLFKPVENILVLLKITDIVYSFPTVVYLGVLEIYLSRRVSMLPL